MAPESLETGSEFDTISVTFAASFIVTGMPLEFSFQGAGFKNLEWFSSKKDQILKKKVEFSHLLGDLRYCNSIMSIKRSKYSALLVLRR